MQTVEELLNRVAELEAENHALTDMTKREKICLGFGVIVGVIVGFVLGLVFFIIA